jgi:hypothetical protein
MRLTLAFVTVAAIASPAAADPWPAQFPTAPPMLFTNPQPQPTTVAVTEPAPVVTAVAPIEYEREYGERNVREAGASMGFMVAPKFHSITVAPSFGWFIADNVQVSTILSLTSIKAGADTSTIATATLEPSYHYQLDTKTQLFAGMGFGYSYIRDLGHGLTYTLRVGSQFLFRKKSIFTPSVSYDFRSNHQEPMESLAALASESALRINLGYTTMF